LSATETQRGHKYEFQPTIVENVQLDSEVSSDPICNSSGCTQYLHPNKKLGYPINYDVPNFGRDSVINDNFDSLKYVEGKMGHHWDWVKKKGPKEVTYDNNLPLDEDMITSKHNLKQ
jgi:hypothetical protein